MKKIFAFVFALLLILPQAGSAHSLLVSSTPKADQAADKPVDKITLNFGAAVEKIIKLTIIDSKGHETAIKKPIIHEKTVIVTPERPLKNEAYKVKWELIGIDGHDVHGKLAFSVGQVTPKEKPIKQSANQSNGNHWHYYIPIIIILVVILVIGLLALSRKKRD